MMKWGKQKSKKSSLSSSSRPSFISHVFPTSWLSKFKQLSIHSKSNTKKGATKIGKQNCSSMDYSNEHQLHGRSNGRFYSADGDAFWRLSFGEESQDNKSKAAMSSDWCDLGDEHLVPPLSSHHYRQNTWEQSKDLEVRVDMDLHDEDREFETLRRRFERKAQREFRNKVLEWKRKAVKADVNSNTKEEKDVLQLQSPSTIWTPRKHCLLSPSHIDKGSLATKEADFVLNTHEFDTSPMKMKSELPKLKGKKHRTSLHVSSRKPGHNSKVRVCSPRTASKVEICKVKALEDMKKAKSRMKKEKEKKMVEEMDADMDSFAVVKCSYNPQKDFRDSMVEMITEKQISQPEEMEELLACYLTLNSDEYHDLIIKVFRQVWFELDRASFDTELKVSKLRSL